jgi:uncharacterized MnhB-related membrane protein
MPLYIGPVSSGSHIVVCNTVLVTIIKPYRNLLLLLLACLITTQQHLYHSLVYIAVRSFLACCVCLGRTLCVSGDLSEVASPTGGRLRS